jgi:iron-sulfur cluster repair protein YtfE (RIC family)
MFLIDKAVTGVAPAQTSERRIKARSKVRDLGRHCDWLRLVVQQHEQIEQVLAQLAAAVDVAGARRAEQTLATLLTGHSVAEEAVLYPAMASARQKAHAVTFSEQARLKVHLAALAAREPATPDWRAELDRLAQAISEHIFDEECSWFPALAKVDDAALQARLSARFVAEYERYMGSDVPA